MVTELIGDHSLSSSEAHFVLGINMRSMHFRNIWSKVTHLEVFMTHAVYALYVFGDVKDGL
jgi:hypothetical protein